MIWIRHSLSRAALLSGAITSMLAACGGKVVVDAEGATGAGGDSTTTATTMSTSIVGPGAGGFGGSGGAGGCSGLEDDVANKIAAAQACSPVLAVIQCSGAVTTVDLCGCTVVANDTKAEEAKIAFLAFEDWVSVGCGPYDCESCPPGPDTPWYCDEATESCKPAFEK